MSKIQMGRSSAVAAAVALVLGSVAPATAASRDPVPVRSSQDEATAPTAKKSNRYCITTDQVGSRLQRRLCKTRDQWISEDGFDPIGARSAN
ncbi:hypothetical protein P1X14_10815 [Sphingomonas sp. AOB5]|uniref:hypothetical protein n=1 Tax=Sphingomonas sp. AOB5 TaxID=3034017 RepID=UPI0023F72324|nr:hypothetical protein [Sphingomonas sp. AOB5]MDF7775738.1 hypothetical protein [Sphingomonas sp. AOB5]